MLILSLTLDRIGELLAQKGKLEMTAENKKQLELILAHVQSGKQFVKPEANLGFNSTVDVVTNLLQIVQQHLVEHAVALEVIRGGGRRGLAAAVLAHEVEEEVADPIILAEEEKVENFVAMMTRRTCQNLRCGVKNPRDVRLAVKREQGTTTFGVRCKYDENYFFGL
jgi:hypothetical protein